MKKERKILDEVSDYMRLHHYSIHTERSYCDWIRRFILFHRMTSRKDLKDGEPKIARFLTHLAVDGHLSPSAQNQAMNALVFFYRKFLGWELDKKIDAVRAKSRQKVPVVMTREEVSRVIFLMIGTPKLVSKLLYGSGLRLSEAIRLRVHDIDFEMKSITVRSGKGVKDRVTTFPASVIPELKSHFACQETSLNVPVIIGKIKSVFLSVFVDLLDNCPIAYEIGICGFCRNPQIGFLRQTRSKTPILKTPLRPLPGTTRKPRFYEECVKCLGCRRYQLKSH